jgi:hypothetical protein
MEHTNSKQTTFLNGYIQKSKIILLPYCTSSDADPFFTDIYTIDKEGFKVVATKTTFNPNKHRLFYRKAVPDKYIAAGLVKIDDKPFWGTDEKLPNEVISSLKIIKRYHYNVTGFCFLRFI